MVVFEIVEELGVVFDYYCLLVGNVGNIIVYWMGYFEYKKVGICNIVFKMVGY